MNRKCCWLVLQCCSNVLLLGRNDLDIFSRTSKTNGHQLKHCKPFGILAHCCQAALFAQKNPKGYLGA